MFSATRHSTCCSCIQKPDDAAKPVTLPGTPGADVPDTGLPEMDSGEFNKVVDAEFARVIGLARGAR